MKDLTQEQINKMSQEEINEYFGERMVILESVITGNKEVYFADDDIVLEIEEMEKEILNDEE